MSFFKNPILSCDYYKVGHPFMQPPETTTVYSTWTARSNKHHPNCPKTVVFGYQYTIMQIKDFFQENFFNADLDELESEYQEIIADTFNTRYNDFTRFRKLWELRYLPIAICGVPEGTLLPPNVPSHVIFNTHPDFAWLPQYLEDIWSANNWLPSTSATTAYYRKKQLKNYVDIMCDNPAEVLERMCGDFSMRGHTSIDAAAISGAGHLLSFDRTATVLSNTLIKKYYHEPNHEPDFRGIGTPSLEHSVVEQGVAWMTDRLLSGTLPEYTKRYVEIATTQDISVRLISEMCFILYLIKEVQPTGVLTYVSDTYDYWGVVFDILPIIKDEILNRQGCFSVRPDSGDPTHIICGDKTADDYRERTGTLQALLNTFGYTKNTKGYKVLPPQIRMIYGDAITSEVTGNVCAYCRQAAISIENICFGIGAYTYQYVTRDTRGFAIKATDCIRGGNEFPIFKNPKTASWKASLKGAVSVHRTQYLNNGPEYQVVDGLTIAESVDDPDNVMRLIFKDGKFFSYESFMTIRKRLANEEMPGFNHR